jgi:hypothetical protein
LRILYISALDVVHRLRFARGLPRRRRREVATFLDFQACTNAAWDRKAFCIGDYRALRQSLEDAGLEAWVRDYLQQLHTLETGRPPFGGDGGRFAGVRMYREGVARVSLATTAALALNLDSVDAGVRATHSDSDLATLFQMAMLCQIVDDAVDYTVDVSSNLPSFMTASASLSQAVASSLDAARTYGRSPERACGSAAFPLRIALAILTAVACLVLRGRSLREERRSGYRAAEARAGIHARPVRKPSA